MIKKNCKDCIYCLEIKSSYFCKHKKDIIAIANINNICKKYKLKKRGKNERTKHYRRQRTFWYNF